MVYKALCNLTICFACANTLLVVPDCVNTKTQQVPPLYFVSCCNRFDQMNCSTQLRQNFLAGPKTIVCTSNSRVNSTVKACKTRQFYSQCGKSNGGFKINSVQIHENKMIVSGLFLYRQNHFFRTYFVHLNCLNLVTQTKRNCKSD